MMNRRKIQEGYDQMAPTHEQKDRMLESILTAASARQPAGKDVPMKKFNRKPLMAAAIIAVSMLLVGCTAAVVLRLNDLRIGEYSYTQPAWINADGELIEETQVTKSVFSLQGITGSNSQKAAREWYEFDQSYDPDHTILQVSDDFQAPREYDAYSVYSQEMIDKVDEIVEKYGLKLAGQVAIVQDWSKDIFYDALGIGSLLVKDAQAEMGLGAGYFYACGNFELEFECNVKDPRFQWEHPLFLSVNYKDKGYLDTVFTYLDVTEDTEQWIYTLADGTEVLIVLAENAQVGDSAHVFCDREDAFVTARLDTSYFNDDGTVESMRKEDIELAVSMIDFSVKPQKPDMAEAVKQLDAADQKYREELDAQMAALGDPLRVSSYKELSGVYGKGYYFFTDLNNDSAEECIFWDEWGNGEVYTMIDGKTEPILQIGGDMYLCENSVVETYEEVGAAYYIHGYYKMEGNEMVCLDRLVFDRANEEWSRSDNGIRAEETITTEEAETIIASYVRIDVEKKPVSELQ